MTGRVHGELFLLRPDEGCNALILEWLARAMARHPIEIYALQFMSNHYHMLVRDPHGNLADFMEHFAGRVARAINLLRGRSGQLWHDRYHSQPVLDDDAVLQRFLYTLTNPVKDGLVDRTEDWPGISSYGATVEGKTICVNVFGRQAWIKAGRPRDKSKFRKNVVLEILPLPIWESLPPDEQRAAAREAIRVHEAEFTVGRRPKKREQARRKLQRINPFGRPKEPKFSPEPLCHTTCRQLRREFEELWREFNEAYGEAAKLVRAGVATVARAVFPRGSYPPSLPRPWP